MPQRNPAESPSVAAFYNEQAAAFAAIAESRFAWGFLERPAFDRYVSDLYQPETRVLDIGCGTGVVARHLASRGILPQNIVGVDPSRGQLEQARASTPGVRFIVASADSFELPDGSIDLVTTNTVLHHLDNEELRAMLKRVYDVLAPGGCYFFVEVDPDHSEQGRDPKNINKWTSVRTPWGTEVPFFNRDPRELMNLLDICGFDKVSGWLLSVSPEGIEDPENFAKYSGRPSRMSARFVKVPPRDRVLRENDVRIPQLIETVDQQVMHDLVDRYFRAWRGQSLDEITQIFAPHATYDEKPGEEPVVEGIEAIQEYWKRNPLSQRNILVQYEIIGFSGGSSIWVEFAAGFDVRGRHIDVDGVIQFLIDINNRKFVALSEHFTTIKQVPM